MARPSKLTPETVEKILEMIRAGNWRSVAAVKSGITKDCLAKWEKRGRTGDEPYKSFIEQLDEAESDLENRILRELQATKNPAEVKTRTFLLERRFTRRWGEAIRIKEAAREIEEERRPKTELALETVIGLLNDAGYTVTKRDDGD